MSCLFMLLQWLASSAYPYKIQASALEQVFSPLKWLDAAQIYDQYATVIDFFIYLVVFLGVAQVTLGKRFEGRGGKAITVGIGVLLAVSLTITERAMNFNLRAFGPIAACIFVMLVGVTIYLVVKEIGGGGIGAGAVAYIIVYFSLRAVTPSVFDWVAVKMPLIHLLLVAAVFVAIYEVITRALLKKGSVSDNLSRLIKEPRETARKILPGYREWEELRQEKGIVKKKMQPFVAKERKESKQIIRDLEAVMDVIDEHRESERARTLIARHLLDILPKEHHLYQVLQRVKEMDARIEAFDLSLFEKLRTSYPKLSKVKQRLIKEAILQERKKIGCEERIKTLSNEIEHYTSNVSNCLNMAANNLVAAHVDEAKRWIGEAIKYESEAFTLLSRIIRLEARLKQLAGRQMKEFRIAQTAQR